MTQSPGEVYDIGYQPYAGPREGRARARWALWLNGVRAALGLGRGWSSKVLPIILLIALLIPALVFTLIGSILGELGNNLPGQADYYRAAFVPLIIFSAIIAPELLCADRRDQVINLYLVRPLTSTDYVAARWLAFFSISLVLVYLPQLVLFIGLTLGASDPKSYLSSNWLDLPRFIGAGLTLALFTATLPLAAAAFTTRRAYAAVFVIGLWFIGAATGGILSDVVKGSAGSWLSLINIGFVPILINDIIFDNTANSGAAGELPKAVVIGWYMLLTIGPGAVLWWRYRRLGI